jgi:hypothetical protein
MSELEGFTVISSVVGPDQLTSPTLKESIEAIHRAFTGIPVNVILCI